MTILGIETSTSVCSASVSKDGQLIQQYICREGSNHAKLLPLYIEQLLTDAKAQSLTINAVALSEGPGSYTGLRIGTSTAKGLCYGLNVPLIPVPTLQVLNAAAKDKGADGLLCPMIDARRMEVYTALYDTDLHPLSDIKAVVVDSEDCLYAGDENICYFGDGGGKCTEVLRKPNWHFISDIIPESRYLATIIEAKAGQLAYITDQLAYYEPYYLKEFIAAQSHVKGLH